MHYLWGGHMIYWHGNATFENKCSILLIKPGAQVEIQAALWKQGRMIILYLSYLNEIFWTDRLELWFFSL